VTLGLTNTEIAERLSINSKTVEKHLASIFVKLGIRSRAQIAAFVAREGHEGGPGAAMRFSVTT